MMTITMIIIIITTMIITNGRSIRKAPALNEVPLRSFLTAALL